MTRKPGPGRDSGASALEFALVVPVLLLLVFGILDYGIYFANTLGAESGVREASRRAAVEEFPAGACSGVSAKSGDPDLQKTACLAVTAASPVSGTAFARVVAPPPPASWAKGQDVRVCLVVDGQSVTNFVPLPDSGRFRTRLSMRIEQDTKAPSGSAEARTSAGSTTPPGGWGWCG